MSVKHWSRVARTFSETKALQRLLYIRVLGKVANLLIDFRASLCTLAEAAKQLDKEFLWILHWHD
jgi:hypothetical protein